MAVVAYARPLGATPVALAALVPNDQVRIADRITWYEMIPIREDQAGNEILPTTGLIFVPGARVDARAYAHVLRPLAEAGYFVAVLKEPLGFSILDPDHPESVLAVHPDIAYWALGGHSLGGTTAATAADTHERVNGLVLFGAYPARRIQRTDLKVVSVSGTEDGLTTPAEIERSKADLPPRTQYLEVIGRAHSWFGDYGRQRGDGTPVGRPGGRSGEDGRGHPRPLASLTLPPPPRQEEVPT